MKTLRYSFLLFLCAISSSVQAGDDGITITNHIWEIHKQNGDVIQIPYHSLHELNFSKIDIDGVEQEDFVKQVLTRYFEPELTDRLDSIACMKYVRKTYSNGNEDGNVYSPHGFDVEIEFPNGSSVTHRKDWTELEETEDGKVKVRAGRNKSVFWRQDTIDVTYPNGTTVSIPFEQPGDEIFHSMEFFASISADIKNTNYEDGETTSSITWGSGWNWGTRGTKDCELIGKLGDRKHTYVVTINQHTDDSTPTVDGDIPGYTDWKLNIRVSIDVSFDPGKVEAATIYEYNNSLSYGDRHYTDIFQASFGMMEGAHNGSFWTYEVPNSFKWEHYNVIDSDPPSRHTEEILNLLGGSCSINFYY